jgi:hypothetical protein
MFVGVEPEAQALILEFYATEAEATDAAQSLPADGFDERTAGLLARSGVLAEEVWERLPSEVAVARDAITAIGRVGMTLAGPSAGLAYRPFAERFLQFALGADTDVFRDRDHLSRTLLRCHESEGRPCADLNVEEQLPFPEQCLWIRKEEGADDEAPLMLFDYIVAGRVTEANDVVTFAYAGLIENSRTPLGKVYFSQDGYLIHQLGLPRDRFTPPLLRATAQLTVKSGLAVRQRLRGGNGENA